jgi:hypothetical protein
MSQVQLRELKITFVDIAAKMGCLTILASALSAFTWRTKRAFLTAADLQEPAQPKHSEPMIMPASQILLLQPIEKPGGSPIERLRNFNLGIAYFSDEAERFFYAKAELEFSALEFSCAHCVNQWHTTWRWCPYCQSPVTAEGTIDHALATRYYQ